MADIPELTSTAVRERVGQRSYGLGYEYFRDAAVFAGRKEGATLTARCRGSSGGPYCIRVSFNKSGIADARCSCPVGDEGSCKHVAAVLLTWMDKPGKFEAVESVEARLSKRTKEELIALIQQMVKRKPELEPLLDVALPVAGKRSGKADAKAYYKQAEALFEDMGEEWGALREVISEVEDILAIGQTFREQGDTAGALAVCQGVLSAVMDQVGDVYDDEGDLYGLVGSCADALGELLQDKRLDGKKRPAIIRDLFDVLCLDVDEGGRDFSDGAYTALAEHTTPAEKRQLAEWTGKKLRSAERGWAHDAYEAMLATWQKGPKGDPA